VRYGRRAPNRNVKGHFLYGIIIIIIIIRDRSAGEHAGKRDDWIHCMYMILLLLLLLLYEFNNQPVRDVQAIARSQQKKKKEKKRKIKKF